MLECTLEYYLLGKTKFFRKGTSFDMIKIEHLVKNYGSNCAVDDISFEVKKGEIVGLLGPNGAGKSTTMNILTGYLSSTSGNVSVAGINVLDNPLEAKKHIGYLPEQPPLYLDMTVEEYLIFNYNLKGCRLNRDKHLEEICEIVKIRDVYKPTVCYANLGMTGGCRGRKTAPLCKELLVKAPLCKG